MSEKQEIPISAVWLRSEGKHIVVLVERNGEWFEVIRELEKTEDHMGTISHIVESGALMVGKRAS